MNVWEPLPDKLEQKFKKHLNHYTLGNIWSMVLTKVLYKAKCYNAVHNGAICLQNVLVVSFAEKSLFMKRFWQTLPAKKTDFLIFLTHFNEKGC